tara:strand:+ start:290 stop:640 length:351 start_codon:yes stop_codon:yes gene_type:complete
MDLTKQFEKIEKKSELFSDLLDSLESTENKKKMLWKEIYDNAINDRMNAYVLFTGIYTNMGNSTADHISVGPTLSKYLERMNKSNDQLIKLAELIAKEEERADTVDPDDIFSKIDK